MFKHSDRLNPISARNLLLAGKLAKFGSEKTLLDLGSGKGFPSLLWASTFGINVKGFDISNEDVDYANSYARLLNLGHLVEYRCQHIRKLKLDQKYDAVACLGIGITKVYGTAKTALAKFRLIIRPKGFLMLAEPVWLIKPVPEKVQKALGTSEESLCTQAGMERMLKDCGFKLQGSFVSAKEDWEFYVRPVYAAMQEIAKNRPELANETQAIIRSFKAEYQAAGHYWDMILWVAKTC
jgi:SAM-dependent methyltransferase